MSAIRLIRPKRPWSVTPATVLPAGLLARIFRLHWSYTVILDRRAVGKIGIDQVKVFNVYPGEHRLRMRFVLLRRSREMRISLKEGEERVFLCGANGLGWPTLREASSEDVAEIGEAPEPNEPPEPSEQTDSEPPEPSEQTDSEPPEPSEPFGW